MTYRQDAEGVLAVWRAVERALSEAAPGSADAEELQAEAMRLRDRYRALVDEAGHAHADDDPRGGILDGGAVPDATGSA
jgi:hypothetical protein